MTNSELNYQFYGVEENYVAMASMGILTEDVPQLSLQIIYTVCMSSFFETEISVSQIIFFVSLVGGQDLGSHTNILPGITSRLLLS